MAVDKVPVTINFAQGLDTKTDPKQVQVGKFLSLQNSIFDKGGLLQKRNGFAQLASLPDTTSTYLTTFNGNLTAVGNSLRAYSPSSDSWVSKGNIQPVKLDTLPLIRSNTNQSQCDSAISANGLVCTVYTDNVPVSGSNVANYKYVVADSTTGQNIVSPTIIPVTTGTVTGSPRVFVLGNYFMILFTNIITATPHLQYVAVNTQNPALVSTNTDISSLYTNNSAVNFDAVVANNSLYVAWNGSDGGGAIRMTYIDSTLVQHNTVTFAGRVATIMSVCADNTTTTPIIYASFYNSGSSTGYNLAVDQALNTIHNPVQIIATGTIPNIASAAQNGVCTVFYETLNTYSFGTPTDFVSTRTVTQSGTVGSATIIKRSVGLASKAFILDSTIYVLTAYSSSYQPSYFLLDSVGNTIAKLAYQNGGGYLTTGLPSVTVSDMTASIAYLIKDLVQAVNKGQGAGVSSPVYSQTGINLVNFNITTEGVVTSEIANNLHLTGGFMWMYDGYSPVEHGFHLYPELVGLATATTGGFLADQIYFYQVTYEWADNQGNIFRSAPSIPQTVTTTGGGTSKVTIKVPTLRVTAKTANPVKIVIYRWSTAQQTYYQVTSITTPLLNDTTVDEVTYVDTLADSSIIGNNILYTTGGVLENIGANACITATLFDSRIFYVNAEDQNLLGYSKQVVETVPVEFSDLLTIYVPPNTATRESTGPVKCLAPMDDKLILFKPNALAYINGRGPNNLGADNQYSEPTFIAGTVGCENQASIVLIPNGLMFQSSKGIWLLGRDLSTKYIGAPVQIYTEDSLVQSAVNVPGTNQVRFTLDSGITLVYDYYYEQWGTFVNVPAISSTIYQGLHTYIDSLGAAYQESPGIYLDGSRPVVMSFKTSWLNLAGIQGFQRAYFFYFLGQYISPHRLSVKLAFDYAPGPSQAMIFTPDNFSPNYGGDPFYGSGSPYGGPLDVEQGRVFFEQQKCQAFQIEITEIYDPSLGVAAGAGLTLSGLDIMVGIKSGYPRLRASRSIG